MEPADAATETEVTEAIERYYVGWFTAEALTKLLCVDLKRKISKRYVEAVLEKMKTERKLEATGEWNTRCYRTRKNRIK
jgi:hypothetical protein